MQYLKNNICNFKPLFDFNPANKKNIVSCAFFKLITSAYKDFNLYIDGLEKLYDKVYIKYKDDKFIIRLFMDNSIYSDEKLYNRIKKMNKLEIILYSCENYIVPNESDYHIGLFYHDRNL